MNFNETNQFFKIGEKLGFVTSYFIFTTFIYLVISFLNKLPDSWGYINVATITLLVTLVNISINRFLE